jgi:hypothetical protein
VYVEITESLLAILRPLRTPGAKVQTIECRLVWLLACPSIGALSWTSQALGMALVKDLSASNKASISLSSRLRASAADCKSACLASCSRLTTD